jgi:hypothetical protein
MSFLTLIAVLIGVPAQAGVSLRWAPALDQALAGLNGPARDIAQNFDAEALQGLQVRLNEIHALSSVGIDDLNARRRSQRRPVASVPVERRAALERSLTIFTPVIARLEARGVRLDERGNASTDLATALSRAIEDEAREADRRARELTSHYGDSRDTLSALADSEAADQLLRERTTYLSPAALDGLARVYDSGRTEMLAARFAAEGRQVTIVSPEESGAMRDAVAENRPSFLRRLAARVRRFAKKYDLK